MKQFSTLLFATGALAGWHANVAYPNGYSPLITNSLFQASVFTSHTVTQWPAGSLPESCRVEMGKRGCAAANVQVYNVTYSDCDRPWVFCRCNSAPVHIGRMADLFGRMPVHLRSIIRHPQILPNDGGGCCCAAPDDGDLLVAGDCPMEVLVHEAGHLVDNRGDVFGEDYSSKTSFINAMAADTCSVTPYANDNGRHENFAEMSVITLYYLKTGLLPAVTAPATTGCFNNQLQNIVTRFGAQFFQYGGVCVNRAPDTPYVPALRKFRSKRQPSKISGRTEGGAYCRAV